jgi:WD40 repeat protein
MFPPIGLRLRTALCVFSMAMAVLMGVSGCARVAGTKAAGQVRYPVSAIAFSPDGKTLATSIGPKSTVWNVETGKELASLENAVPSIYCFAFSPDGKTIAGGMEKIIHLWDADTGKIQKTLEGDKAGLCGLGFSADGKILVSAASLYKFSVTIIELWLWDVDTGKKITELDPKQWVFTSLAMAPDRKSFAVGSLDKSVKIWSLPDKKELASFRAPGQVRHLTYSADGKYLAVADSMPTVALYDAATWKLQGQVENLEELVVMQLAFSPDGKHLAGAIDDQTARIWEVPSLKQSSTLTGHSQTVKEVAYSPNGQILASGSQDGEVRLWDTASGQTRMTLK